MVRKTVPAGDKKYVYYVCSGNKRDKGTCSSHCFPAKKLIRTVTETVSTHIGKMIALSEAVEIISKTESAKPDIVKYEDRISKLREEVESCNSRKKNLYEDFKDEILSKEEYSMLRARYQKQLEEAESCIASLEAERDMILANGSGKQEWIEKIKTYKGIKELDRSLITFLIERIDVIDGNTIQVTYRFREEAEELKRLAELYSIDMKEAV
jgi:chromosome segregation ATPase